MTNFLFWLRLYAEAKFGKVYKFGSWKRLQNAMEPLTKGTDCTGSDETLGPSGASNGQLYRYGTQRYIHLYFKVELGSLCLGNKNVNRYKFFSHSGIFFLYL